MDEQAKEGGELRLGEPEIGFASYLNGELGLRVVELHTGELQAAVSVPIGSDVPEVELERVCLSQAIMQAKAMLEVLRRESAKRAPAETPKSGLILPPGLILPGGGAN